MATYIPGGETLGFTFNIFGAYGPSSRMKPLFDMQYNDQQWNDYLVPTNAMLDTSSKNEGEANSFSSRQKVEEHFGSKVGLSARYGLFSGQFEASFNMTNKSDISYQFGLVETYSKFYSLTLKDSSENALAPWVKSDPDYMNIPSEFTEQNRYLFFRFFDKYGLYFMSSVQLGGRLYYSTSISKSYNYSEKDVKTKIETEFKAIFSAKASASAEWSKVGEQWASSREVKVSATGGSNTILNVLVPGYNANHEDAYNAWLQSAEKNPAVIDFSLTSIADIFSGSKADAVRQAINEYLKYKLYLESKTGTCLINFDNSNVLPPPASELRTYGFQIAAINRLTLKADFRKSYATGDYWSGYEPIYNEMLNDIQPYNNARFIIAFTTFSNFALTAPTPGFTQFLRNCGADVELNTWLDTKASNYGIYSCCALVHNNYVMVGIPGSSKGSAHEKYERTGSCDTGDTSWWYGDGWLDSPAPMASITVDLYLLKNVAVSESEMSAHLAAPRPVLVEA
ncbi:MAG TPA: MAC/perforin domain-containing protein [Saprospiraceae bacterium]|nr:MAC/perforin domain-containing protein [Saprospiraceae bacterium]